MLGQIVERKKIEIKMLKIFGLKSFINFQDR